MSKRRRRKSTEKQTAKQAEKRPDPRAEARAPGIVPIAPKPVASRDESFDVAGDGYREASREEKPLRPPSDLPESPRPVLRNRVLLVAVWTIVVARFAVAVRAHGLSTRGLLVGALSTVAILPIVIGVIVLLLPER